MAAFGGAVLRHGATRAAVGGWRPAGTRAVGFAFGSHGAGLAGGQFTRHAVGKIALRNQCID